jgi:DNA-binding MarR family transcriptional regulator
LPPIKQKDMENKRHPFGMAIGGMMREVVRLLKKRITEQAEIKLSIEQIGLLLVISMQKEEVIQQELACSMGKDKSAILRTIDMLEAKDLVKRVSDTADRRKKYLMITKKGERVIEQYLTIEHELTTLLQNGLSEEDITIFYKVVDHIKTNAKAI